VSWFPSPSLIIMNCSICLEKLKLFHTVAELSCGHCFHSDCWNQWATSTTTLHAKNKQLVACCNCRVSVTRVVTKVNLPRAWQWISEPFRKTIDIEPSTTENHESASSFESTVASTSTIPSSYDCEKRSWTRMLWDILVVAILFECFARLYMVLIPTS
jgi:hypothetical protein